MITAMLNRFKDIGLFIIILILLGVIGYQELRPAKKAAPVVEIHQVAIDNSQAIIDSISVVERRYKEKRKIDSLESRARENAYIRRIKVLESRLVKLKPDIQQVLDSSPEMTEFVGIQDTIIQEQNKRIDSLSVENFTLRKDHIIELDLKDHKFAQAEDINKHLKETADHYRKLNRKLRRQNTVLKIVAVAVSIVAVFKE